MPYVTKTRCRSSLSCLFPHIQPTSSFCGTPITARIFPTTSSHLQIIPQVFSYYFPHPISCLFSTPNSSTALWPWQQGARYPAKKVGWRWTYTSPLLLRSNCDLPFLSDPIPKRTQRPSLCQLIPVFQSQYQQSLPVNTAVEQAREADNTQSS